MDTVKSCKGGLCVVDRQAAGRLILLAQPDVARPFAGQRKGFHSGANTRQLARLAAAMAFLAAAFWGYPSQLIAAERSDAGAPVDMVVTVVKAKNMCFADTLQVTGVVTPKDEILVKPDREGLRISQVLVEVGDSVVSGQVLARLAQPEGQQGNAASVQAPAAGIISSRTAAVGAPASARGEPLFRIATGGEMELLAETPIKTIARLKTDQPARVEIVGVGALQGKVRHISTSINAATQLGEIRLFIGRDARLRFGAFGRATIEIARRCGAAVPFSAVLYSPNGTVVQTVRDGRVETRPVTVGLQSGGQAEIRQGIAEGEMVIPRSGAFVRDGDRVRSMAPSQ